MNLTFNTQSSLILILFYLANLTISQPTIADDIIIIKTPKECFDEIEDYPFKENHLTISPQLSMHYVDEGDKDAPVVLLLHGEPSWSYAYRNVIPALVKSGYRVIAPDLIGFGKSDKLIQPNSHTYSGHTLWLKSFIHQLNLRNINVFAHDWGGMLALRVIAHEPQLFSKVIISNAFLFTGYESFPESFVQWQQYSQKDKKFNVGTISDWGSYTKLTNSIKWAYNAPFPSEKHKTAARRFPMLIPAHKNDPEAIINLELRESLKTFSKPFLTVWSSHEDKMWQGKDTILQTEISGAKGQNHKVLKAGHFIQEDQSFKLTEIMLEFFSN